jgi:hypothetical protein
MGHSTQFKPRAWLSLSLDYVAASVTHFIAFEVFDSIDRVGRSLASGRQRPPVSVLRMKASVHVTAKVFRSVKPWTDANENAAGEPLRAVVAIGSAIIRRYIIVAVRALWRSSDLDAYLSLCFRSGHCETHCNNNGQCKIPKSDHESTSRVGLSDLGPESFWCPASALGCQNQACGAGVNGCAESQLLGPPGNLWWRVLTIE